MRKLSLTDSESNQSLRTKEKILELFNLTYANEVLAHINEEDEDPEEDQDGLFPAVLRARFEDEVTVDNG